MSSFRPPHGLMPQRRAGRRTDLPASGSRVYEPFGVLSQVQSAMHLSLVHTNLPGGLLIKNIGNRVASGVFGAVQRGVGLIDQSRSAETLSRDHTGHTKAAGSSDLASIAGNDGLRRNGLMEDFDAPHLLPDRHLTDATTIGPSSRRLKHSLHG